jgi:hypothetical protein
LHTTTGEEHMTHIEEVQAWELGVEYAEAKLKELNA